MLDRGVLRSAPQLARPDLVRVALAAPVALLEAPGGSGKTTLAAQVARELDRPTVRAVIERDVPLAAALAAGARRSGLASWGEGDVVAALLDADPDRPVLVAVDEIQRATPADLDLVLRLAAAAGPGHQLLVLGRRLDQRLVAYAADHELAVIDAEALRFSRQQVAELLVSLERDPAAAEAIHRATEGWPAAVVLAARATLDPAGYGSTDVVDVLVEHLLGELDEGSRTVVARVGALSPVSREVAEAAGGPGALDRLLDAGVPLRVRSDGWAEVSDPVREALAPYAALDTATARAVAAAYRRGGEPMPALRLLLEGDDLDGVVELLASMPWPTMARVPVGYLDLVLARIDDARMREHVEILAVAALAADHVDPHRRRAWLERGRGISVAGPGRRAVLAELGRDLQRDMRYDEAAPLLAEVLDQATEDEARTRGRALLADGLRRLVLEQAGVSDTTVEQLERAAAELGRAGEHRLEAAALTTVGFGVNFTAGRLELAEEQLTRALALLAAPDLARATQLPYLADVVRDRGDLDRAEALLRESLSIGTRLGSTQTIGYAHWSLAWVAADRRDAVALDHHLAEARPRTATPGTTAGRASTSSPTRPRCACSSTSRRIALVAIVECERRSAGTGYDWPALSVRARYEATYGDAEAARSLLEELELDRCRARPAAAPAAARGGRAARRWHPAAVAGRCGAGRGQHRRPRPAAPAGARARRARRRHGGAGADAHRRAAAGQLRGAARRRAAHAGGRPALDPGQASSRSSALATSSRWSTRSGPTPTSRPGAPGCATC